jgi:hypothetical protein
LQFTEEANNHGYGVDAAWLRDVIGFRTHEWNLSSLQRRKLENFFSVLPRTGSSIRQPLKFLDSREVLIEKIYLSNRPSKTVAVFIETRPMHGRIGLINAFAAAKIPLIAFVSESDSLHLMSALGHETLYGLYAIRYKKFGLACYNALVISGRLWACLPSQAEHILFLQSDVALSLGSSMASLEQFLKYDYIGSKWNINRPIGLRIHGGNGGMSLRSVRYCRTASKMFSSIGWPGGEDGFFAFFTEFLGGVVAKNYECDNFCIQERSALRSIPFGFHKKPSDFSSHREYYLQACPSLAYI